MLAGDQVLPIGRPDRIVEQAEILLGYLQGRGAVAIHHPDVVGPAAIAGKADQVSVRAEAGLHLEGQAAGQQPGFAAADRHDVDIAQKIEHDLFSVRADIEVHPTAFADREADRIGRAILYGTIPIFKIRLALVGGIRFSAQNAGA